MAGATNGELGGGGVGGNGPTSVPQMVQPKRVTDWSVYQVMAVPGCRCRFMGPLVPLYWLPAMAK